MSSTPVRVLRVVRNPFDNVMRAAARLPTGGFWPAHTFPRERTPEAAAKRHKRILKRAKRYAKFHTYWDDYPGVAARDAHSGGGRGGGADGGSY